MSFEYNKSFEMERRITVGWSMASLMRGLSRQDQLQLYRTSKGAIASSANTFMGERVVAFMEIMDRDVVSGEAGSTVDYGAENAEYINPLDGIEYFVDSWVRHRPSAAAFSLGSVEEGRIVRGVVSFPLLKTPHLYWSEGGETFLQTQWHGPDDQRFVADTASRGIILAPETSHPSKERLKRMGFNVVSFGGLAFKAACVADPQLLRRHMPQVAGRDVVVGCISSTAQAHDYAGVASIVVGAGGFTGPLPLTAGKHGCVFANNEQNRDLMLEALQAPS